MKQFPIYLAFLILGAVCMVSYTASAAFAPISVPAGGTGTTTSQSARLIYGGGAGVYQATATTTLSGNSQVAVSNSPVVIGGTPTVLSIVADSIGDTQLAFNTGQNLTTASSPTFAGLTLSGLYDGCLNAASGVVGSTGSACGAGGGGGSGTVSTSSSETAGRVPFWTTTSGTPALLSGGSANFVWDNTNSRLGIGSTTPYKALSVVGDAQVSNYLSVGSSTGVAQLPNFLGDFVGNQDAYVTLNLGNNNAGTNASADLTFNNNKTAATGGLGYYTDCGLNSTTYTNATYTGFNQPSQFYCYNTDGPLSFFAASSTGPSYISFGTAGGAIANERARITSTGNFGVGSTTPWAQLSVNPNGIAGPSFAIGSSTGTKFVVTREGYVGIGTSNPLPGTLGRATLVINDPTGANGNELRFTGANTAGKIYTNSSQFGFITETSDREIVISALGSGGAVSLGTNGTTRLSIIGNGNVGIGTTTPTSNFAVSSPAQQSASIPLLTVASTTNASLFTVLGGGSVGVGTTSPTKTFSVNGETYNNSTTTTQGLNVFAPTTGTSTQYIYSKTAGFGAELILEDTDAAGCTKITVLNGTVSGATVTCPTEL